MQERENQFRFLPAVIAVRSSIALSCFFGFVVVVIVVVAAATAAIVFVVVVGGGGEMYFLKNKKPLQLKVMVIT